MLAEIQNCRQVPGEGRRRWFTDSFFDLIVWYQGDGSQIRGFQLCYDKQSSERALTWHRGQGFDHRRIDDGEYPGRMKMTPILVPDGAFDYAVIAERFREESGRIDADIRGFVYKTLMSYSRNGP